MKDKIKLYIISGFLGSGKTTFLRQLLTDMSNRRVGVLINEFGVIGIDGRTIDKNGLEYVEVNNGSIFCSCIKANFLKTMIELQKLDIDTLVIENSGLADPSSMNSILEELSAHMQRGYKYIGSVCIVDATLFLKYYKMLPQLVNQVVSSSFVIINKTDLADKKTVDDIENEIMSLNPNAFIKRAVQADVPISGIEKHLVNSGVIEESYNTPGNRTATYTIKLKKVYKKSSIIAFTKGLSKYALRIKGFVHTDEGWIHVDIVENDYRFKQIQKADDELKAKQGLVIIGKDQTEFDELVTSVWEQYTGELPDFIEE